MLNCGLIVSSGRFDLIRKHAQVHLALLSVDRLFDAGHPFRSLSMPAYTLKYRGLRSLLNSGVANVLTLIADPQFRLPVIELVVVTVINFFAFSSTHNDTVQVN